MTPRICAHPAGCELLAAPGDIYCEGCGTDPTLTEGGEADDLALAPDTPNDHGAGSYYFYDERD